MSGFPTWGSDIGGYAGPPFDNADLFIRWAQLGAVSPVMEVGGSGQNATPWTLGTAAMAGLRDIGGSPLRALPLPLRAAPAPPACAASRSATPTRTTRARGARRSSSWSAPTCSPRRSPGPGTTPSVYLPPGKWVDLYAGTVVNGGGAALRPARRRSTSSRSTCGSARCSRSTCAPRPAPGGASNEQTHPGRAGFLATDGATLDLTGQPAGVQIFVRPRRSRRASRSAATPFPGAGMQARCRASSIACTGRSSKAAYCSRRISARGSSGQAGAAR